MELTSQSTQYLDWLAHELQLLVNGFSLRAGSDSKRLMDSDVSHVSVTDDVDISGLSQG